MINTGKALYWGTSEWTAQELATAQGIADRLGLIGPTMEQPHYNLLVREKVEKEFALLYDSANGGIGLGLTIFSPLKIGILTGKYNDGIPEDSRLATAKDGFITMMNETYGNEDWQKQFEIVRKLKPVADKLGCSQAQLAMAWVLANPRISSAIMGASKVSQVHEAVKSLELLPKMTKDIMDEIDEIAGNKPEPLVQRY